jgi:hypothetical protein
MQEHAMSGTKKVTGNDPAEGADPGGTHSTKPGNPDKGGSAGAGTVKENVESGDRNDRPPER